MTFVLGHDTHGHAEESVKGCRASCTDADDVVARRQRLRRRSAPRYTDHGGAGGVPALTTTSQHQIRQKHQEVEFVVNQSGTNTAANTDGGGRRAPRQPGAGDWLQLNGPFNLTNIDSITFRAADAANGRTPGRRWRRSRSVRTRPPGRS